MKELKVKTIQVEGGRWQASFEGATDNTFGQGDTEDEAKQNLLERSLQARADMGNLSSPPAGSLGATQEPGPTINETIVAKVNRLIVQPLPGPTKLADGSTVTHVCYREDDPATQGYGIDEQSAKVAFLSLKKP